MKEKLIQKGKAAIQNAALYSHFKTCLPSSKDKIKEKGKRDETITGFSRLIERRNVISAKIMRRRPERKLGRFSNAVAGNSFKSRLLYSNMKKF